MGVPAVLICAITIRANPQSAVLVLQFLVLALVLASVGLCVPSLYWLLVLVLVVRQVGGLGVVLLVFVSGFVSSFLWCWC